MANTRIQVKRSTTTAAPSGGSLSAGEIAYSYSSNILFVGSSAGNDVLPLGGKYYVEKTNSAYDIAIASFASGNAAAGGSIAEAYNKANSANYFAYLVNANTVAAFDSENITRAIAIAAYGNANSKFSASGGTINGDVNISGNLTLTGNTTFINVASYVIGDPLLYLASNNYVSDIVDIGFIANYVNATGSNVHTGFFRDAGTKEYYVFEGYDEEPHNNVIDPAGNNFTISVLNATLRTSNIILGGINAISWIRSSYDTTNLVAGAVTTANTIAIAAFLQANNVGGALNTTNIAATYAFSTANIANTIAIAAFAAANAASGGGTTDANNITSGILAVAYGGTGLNSVATNGVLYGNATGPLAITSAGTEGQVLQAGSTGIPSFAMLDGGSF